MSWVIWITGLPGSGKTTLARGAVQALASRGIRVSLIEFPEIYRSLVPEPHGSEAEHEVVHRALVSMAKALSDSGVPVVVDAAAPRRAWRDLARRTVKCFAEVQLTCPPEVCGTRERATRWGLVAEGGGPRPGTAAPPELATAYEYSLRPDLTIPTDIKTIWIAVDEVVRLALGLHRQVSGPPRD
ncbi:MAG TPA: adenylyl-sulfate kinase [Candidatus Binatia bacterium]|nr:adenylyl-sulfate kinase [Candidatus Binatia bacterium]